MILINSDLNGAIATRESVEQHLDLTRKAIAGDDCCQDENYSHVFINMILNLSGFRKNANKYN